jgi:hypothetical protein
MDDNVQKLSEEVWYYLDQERMNFTTTLHKNDELIKKIKSIDSYSFILFNFKTYASYHLEDLFVNTAFLWDNLSINDIKNLSKELFEAECFEGSFALITLFSKYLRIDLSELIFNLNICNNEFRKNILSIRNIGNYKIHKKDIDFMEKSAIEIEKFEQIRQKFILQGLSANKNEAYLYTY